MAAAHTTVRVNLADRAYDIRIGHGLLHTLGEHLQSQCPARRATIITDSNVGPLYLEQTLTSLAASGIDPAHITIPAGEDAKSLAQLSAIYDHLAARRHGRDEPLIALGGGVVGDITGLAAATWLRGVPFVQCPTTLEADIDASVGGKTGINHAEGKNLIGAFHQPRLVCIDTACLATLSPRDFIAGLAESVKHAIIADPALLDWHAANIDGIQRLNPEALCTLISRNCRIKADVVERDERENSGEEVGRAALNFGHTIGHAIEAQLQYILRHGEAVALGMVAALDLSVRCAGLPEGDRQRLLSLLARLGLPVRSPIPLHVPDLVERLRTDKKVRDQQVRFVVLPGIGSTAWLIAPPMEHIEAAIAALA